MVRCVRSSVLTLAVVMAAATIVVAAGPAVAQTYGDPTPMAPPSQQEASQHHPATGTHEQHGGVVEVDIWDFFFEPALLSVAPGTTVVWVNRGAHPHTVTAFDGSFDSGVLMPGDAFAVTFGGSGRVWYFCEIHPSMTGAVTVGDGGGTASFAFARAGGTTARAGVP
jgi:plastocyanin